MKTIEEKVAELGLEEDKQKQVVAVLKSELDNAYVPKFRFTEVNEKLKAAAQELAEATKTKTTVEELQAKLKEASELNKKQAADFEAEKANTRKIAAIEKALEGKVHDSELVKTLLKIDDVKVDDKGTVTGLDEQLKTIAESKPFLWKTSEVAGNGKKSTELKQGGTGEKSVAQQLAEARLAQQKTAEAASKFFN